MADYLIVWLGLNVNHILSKNVLNRILLFTILFYWKVRHDQESDESDLELVLLEDYAIIARDLYAYYPLLLRYIDISK